MEAILNNIGEYILLYAPIVVSVLGSIATIISAIKSIKRTETESTQRIAKLENNLSAVLKENAELKGQLIETLRSNCRVRKNIKEE